MKLQPIIYTTSMDDAVDWYSRVLGTDPGYRSDMWTSFTVGDAELGLHRVDEKPTGSRVELSLVVEGSLEDLVERLEAVQLEIERGIQEETFGRSVVLKDPDGFLVQVNEH